MESLTELRVLQGPNLYFPRAAVKLTLDVGGLIGAPTQDMTVLASRIGLAHARPGEPGSGFRQRFVARAVARLVRQVSAEAGTTRLAVRVRPGTGTDELVVAYPWRNRRRAEALGAAVAEVLDGMPGGEVDALVSAAAARLAEAGTGDPPPTVRPKVPVVAVTGTNGKTTTSRMIAHIGRTAGRYVGWSSTDGIYLDGELVEAGDYSGPSGAGRVLARPEVQLAVTETARGGILLRGIGVTHNDVSVVTNISADHLGLQGIDTLDQLAEVKSVVARITRRDGWCVLNADDPRVLAMRTATRARPWAFSRDPDSPALRDVLAADGRASTVLDGWLSVLRPGHDPEPLIRVTDVPMTLAGLSRVNVENALAAASAALAVGLDPAAVVEGLRSFVPDPALNPGRMNVYSLGDATVILDLAHNEAGLQALLEVMDGLRGPGGRLLLVLGTAGDRTDDVLRSLGEVGGMGADVLAVAHKQHYLRGRDPDGMLELFREGAAAVGVHDVPAFADEVTAVRALAGQLADGDVLGVMCQEQRIETDAWLREQGGSVDGPEQVRAKRLRE